MPKKSTGKSRSDTPAEAQKKARFAKRLQRLVAENEDPRLQKNREYRRGAHDALEAVGDLPVEFKKRRKWPKSGK